MDGLFGENVVIWEQYISDFQLAGIYIGDREDEFVWNGELGEGQIVALDVYNYISLPLQEQVDQCWYWFVWSWNMTLKIKIFGWFAWVDLLVLESAIYTTENVIYLFLQCPNDMGLCFTEF